MTSYILWFFPVLRFLLNESTALSAEDVQYKFFDDNYNLQDEKVMKENKTLIAFIHGYRSSIKTGIVADFGKSLAQLTDSDVAMVDWSAWTEKMDYAEAVAALPDVSGYVVEWLQGLRDSGVVKSFDDVTLIGHSLGAQLAGYAGHRLNGTVSRIVALDPAQPNFKSSKRNERIDMHSGQFVMAWHTSTMYFGLREPVGHADFYFNGGQLQPSCNADPVCGHLIVLDYLVDSLKYPNTFPAFRCNAINDCENNIVDKNEPKIYVKMDVPSTTRGLYNTVPEKKDLKIYSRFFRHEI